jgi:hypothetical protein
MPEFADAMRKAFVNADLIARSLPGDGCADVAAGLADIERRALVARGERS